MQGTEDHGGPPTPEEVRPGWRRSFDGWPRPLRIIGWLVAWPLLGADGARRRLDLGDLDPYALRAGVVTTAAWVMLIVVAGSTPTSPAPRTFAGTAGSSVAVAEPETSPLDTATERSDDGATATPAPRQPITAPAPSSSPRPTAEPRVETWQVLAVVDGDTLEATSPEGGTERIRLAQVDAPEVDECFGTEATEELQDLAGPGTAFTLRRPAPPYEDPHGRTLGELVLTDGSSVNVRLLRRGAAEFGEGFADEDPDLARRMRAAEASARAEGAGLWSACSAPQPVRPQPTTDEPSAAGVHAGRTDGGWGCHPAYRECLPQGPDLDCAEVGHQVVLLGDADPYRLDGNSTTRTDGVGCESYPAWSASQTYPYY